MQVFTVAEHKFLEEDSKAEIKKLGLELCTNSEQTQFLNLKTDYSVGYFIGVDWLKTNECALMVTPKIKHLDCLKMFIDCFNYPEIAPFLKDIYEIKFKEPSITLETNPFELTPLIVFHFLNTVKSIVKKGLKKDYIRIEDNLNSKIKGKIIFNKSLKINNFKGRLDRNYCNFQEYSVDCIENRFLKKALIFVKSYLQRHYKNEVNLLNTLNYCISAFSEVTEEVEINKIKSFKINPLFKEYAEGLKLAKMVLQQFSYNISETTALSKTKIPPFYINMPLLFELYTYGKLKKQFGKSILFQVKGKYGNVDFLDIERKIVIDTKYILLYNEEKYEIDNVRQLSGYARDKGILKKLELNDTGKIVDCLIIYPSNKGIENEDFDFSKSGLEKETIKQFEQFYKVGIKLPTKSSS